MVATPVVRRCWGALGHLGPIGASTGHPEPSFISVVILGGRERDARHGVATSDSYESIAKFHIAVESELPAERTATTAATAKCRERELGCSCSRGGRSRRRGECGDRERYTDEREHGERRTTDSKAGSGW